MANVELDNLKSVRRALGKSQSEIATLLGISTRAVQSYEQGWRPVPPYVQRFAGLLLFSKWRIEHGACEPCWEVRACDPAVRAECPAHQFQAGNFCWLITGDLCEGKKETTWQEKLARCKECPVMTRWLGSSPVQDSS